MTLGDVDLAASFLEADYRKLAKGCVILRDFGLALAAPFLGAGL